MTRNHEAGNVTNLGNHEAGMTQIWGTTRRNDTCHARDAAAEAQVGPRERIRCFSLVAGLNARPYLPDMYIVPVLSRVLLPCPLSFLPLGSR